MNQKSHTFTENGLLLRLKTKVDNTLKNDYGSYVCQMTCKWTVSTEVLENIPFSNCLQNNTTDRQKEQINDWT